MKKETIFYSIITFLILILSMSFLFSQYMAYKNFQLAKEQAIEDCIEKNTGTGPTGFIAANKAQKCRDKFSR